MPNYIHICAGQVTVPIRAVSHNSTRWSITFAYEIDWQGMHTRKPRKLVWIDRTHHFVRSGHEPANHIVVVLSVLVAVVALAARLFMFWCGSFSSYIKYLSAMRTWTRACASSRYSQLGWISGDGVAGLRVHWKKEQSLKPMQAFNVYRTFTETWHTCMESRVRVLVSWGM